MKYPSYAHTLEQIALHDECIMVLTAENRAALRDLSLIHISEPTRPY